VFFFLPFFAGRLMNLATSGGCRFGFGDRFSQIRPSLVSILNVIKLARNAVFILLQESEVL
jgi:hypothetical protein